MGHCLMFVNTFYQVYNKRINIMDESSVLPLDLCILSMDILMANLSK